MASVSHAEVERLYCDEGLTMAEVASQLGTSYSAIQRVMYRHDIPRRPRWASGKHLERMGFPRNEPPVDDWFDF